MFALFQLERQQSENGVRFQIRVWLCLKTQVFTVVLSTPGKKH